MKRLSLFAMLAMAFVWAGPAAAEKFPSPDPGGTTLAPEGIRWIPGSNDLEVRLARVRGTDGPLRVECRVGRRVLPASWKNGEGGVKVLRFKHPEMRSNTVRVSLLGGKERKERDVVFVVRRAVPRRPGENASPVQKKVLAGNSSSKAGSPERKDVL